LQDGVSVRHGQRGLGSAGTLHHDVTLRHDGWRQAAGYGVWLKSSARALEDFPEIEVDYVEDMVDKVRPFGAMVKFD
jgi:hypothetical protein